MPQMNPINWLSLFLIFSITFILFSIMNYYLFLPQSPKMSSKKILLNKQLNWKW